MTKSQDNNADSEIEELEAEIDSGNPDDYNSASNITPGVVNANSILVPIFALLILLLIGGLFLAAYLSVQRSTARQELKAENIELTQLEFLKSVKNGSEENISRFLKAGFDPTEKSSRGESALTIAIERGNLKIIDRLLKELGRITENEISTLKLTSELSLARLNESECKGVTAPLKNLAASKGSIGTLLLLEKYGSDLINPSKGRLSPLFCAVANNNSVSADFLLSHGAEPNRLEATTKSLLSYAADSPGLFQLLLDRGADPKLGESPIFEIAKSGNEAVLALLLKNNIDLNKRNYRGEKPWQVAEAANNLDLVPLLHPEYLLYAGLVRENPLLVFFALERGARLNVSDRDGVTPLHIALSSGKPAEYRYLIQTTSAPAFAGGGKSTPRKTDAYSIHAQLEALRQLEKRLKPKDSEFSQDDLEEDSLFSTLNAPPRLLQDIDGGKSPSLPNSVNASIKEDAADIISILIDTGANITAKDRSGNTPLHFAVLRGDIEIIKRLVAKGANPDEPNLQGLTSIGLAVERRNPAIAELLLSLRSLGASNQNLDKILVSAVEGGLNSVATRLLAIGISPELTDKADRPLVTVALSQSNFELAEALVRYGAKVNFESNLIKSLYSYSKTAKNSRLKLFFEKHGLNLNQEEIERFEKEVKHTSPHYLETFQKR